MSLVEFVIDKLDDLKGMEIVHFDVKAKSSITENMIICTGASSVKSLLWPITLLRNVKSRYETFGEEGRNTADWIVVDLGQTIVHIMQRDAREMYQLEKLWA